MDFDTNDSINPGMDDLLQEEGARDPAVDVRHVGPVLTHQLPARVAHSRNVNVTESSDPALLEIIASEDQRRQYVTIICTGQPIFVAHEKQQAADGVAGILPINTPLTLLTSAPVWVRSAAVGVAVVSYWVGNWAD